MNFGRIAEEQGRNQKLFSCSHWREAELQKMNMSSELNEENVIWPCLPYASRLVDSDRDSHRGQPTDNDDLGIFIGLLPKFSMPSPMSQDWFMDAVW